MNATIGKAFKESAIERGALRDAGEGVVYCIDYDSRAKTILTAWAGRSNKPVLRYYYESPAAALKAVRELVEETAKANAYAAEHKAEQASRKAKMLEKIQVGTILCYSWGYEQTNIDYFQVVDRTKASAKLRKIAAEKVADTGPFSSRVKPVRDQFVSDEVITKRINAYGVSFDHGIADPVAEGETHYCSWGH